MSISRNSSLYAILGVLGSYCVCLSAHTRTRSSLRNHASTHLFSFHSAQLHSVSLSFYYIKATIYYLHSKEQTQYPRLQTSSLSILCSFSFFHQFFSRFNISVLSQSGSLIHGPQSHPTQPNPVLLSVLLFIFDTFTFSSPTLVQSAECLSAGESFVKECYRSRPPFAASSVRPSFSSEMAGLNPFSFPSRWNFLECKIVFFAAKRGLRGTCWENTRWPARI